MKPKTAESNHKRIQRVVRFLNDHVEDNPSLEKLADVAAVSPFHFHRVYRAATGETPSGTLRRLRLARACHLLKDNARPITNIAFDVGYDTSQSFAKAFRSVTGYSPSEIRKSPLDLDKVLAQLSIPAQQLNEPACKIEVKVVTVEPFKVIASRHLGPHKGLFQAYGELFAWAEESGQLEQFQGIYGVPLDDPRDAPDDECRFDCCFDFGAGAVASGPFTNQTIGGGAYAVARHTGPYDGIEEKYDYIYGHWLDASAYSLREQTFYSHYLNDPDTVPPKEWITDIHIPIQRSV